MKRLDDPTAFVCRPDATIREAIARIDATTPHLFQIIADADGRVLGALTDGDIRRGFARGSDLTAPVTDFMHAPPVLGDPNDPAENRRRIQGRRFLPICDADGRLLHILVEAAAGERSISRALIMAGGFGTRLGERTKTTPKPLLEVGGKPILGRIMDRLAAAGVEEIAVSVHYLAEQIERFVEAYDGGPRVEVVRETQPLGTAGALGLLDADRAEPLLVVNGDVLCEVDLNALLDHHLRHDCDGTIAAARYEHQVPYGVIELDEHDMFAGVREKPRLQHLISAGVYYLEPSILQMIPHGQRLDMPDLLAEARADGLKLSVFPIHEYWTDIGKPADFERADARHNGAG